VGLTGLLLVGGQGVLSRHFGLTMDYLAAIELVDESGTLLRATSTNHSELLWLAKGGGSGVQHFPGIITAVEMVGLPKPEPPPRNQTTATQPNQQHPPHPRVYTAFNIKYQQPTVNNAVQLLMAWQRFYQDPEHIQDPLFTRLTVEPWMRLKPRPNRTAKADDRDDYHEMGHFEKQLYLACYFYGNDDRHEEFMRVYYPKLLDLLPGVVDVVVSPVARLSSIKFHRRLSGVRTNKQLTSGQDGWDLERRWKGYSAVASQMVGEGAFRVLAESIFESLPFTERYVELKPLGGAISSSSPRLLRQPGTDQGAFGHRDAQWWLLSSHFLDPSDFATEEGIIPMTDDIPDARPRTKGWKILQTSRRIHGSWEFHGTGFGAVLWGRPCPTHGGHQSTS
jgi:hypothetical protein